MGNPLYWYLSALLFGVFASALYTWMSPRHSGWRSVMARSFALYTVLALIVVTVLLILV